MRLSGDAPTTLNATAQGGCSRYPQNLEPLPSNFSPLNPRFIELSKKTKPNAFFAEGKYWVNNHVHVLDTYIEDDIFLDYIAMRINGMSLADYVTGTAQPKMNQENMNSILILLPPLAEQHRIVSKIEDLFAQIEPLSKALSTPM